MVAIYYVELFPEYATYCGKPVMFVKAMYGMTLSGKYWYLFTQHESDGSFLRIVFNIDDGLYFATSARAL
jgi:hypothetical protein